MVPGGWIYTCNIALDLISGTDSLLHMPLKPLAEVMDTVHGILQ
jgi:hypothetical protein